MDDLTWTAASRALIPVALQHARPNRLPKFALKVNRVVRLGRQAPQTADSLRSRKNLGNHPVSVELQRLAALRADISSLHLQQAGQAVPAPLLVLRLWRRLVLGRMLRQRFSMFSNRSFASLPHRLVPFLPGLMFGVVDGGADSPPGEAGASANGEPASLSGYGATVSALLSYSGLSGASAARRCPPRPSGHGPFAQRYFLVVRQGFNLGPQLSARLLAVQTQKHWLPRNGRFRQPRSRVHVLPNGGLFFWRGELPRKAR